MDRRLFLRVIVGNRTIFLFFISPASSPPGIIGTSSFASEKETGKTGGLKRETLFSFFLTIENFYFEKDQRLD